uniref:Oxalate:formate antiporter n=1 Tax=Panagrolaimus davidi TaxID=227884 RepID=A0A914PMN0_9BILA
MFGAGQGIAYVIAVSTVINWGPKSVGLFSGLVAGAFGISAAIFTPLQTALINPENFVANSEGYFTQPKLLERVPRIFILLSIVYAIMQIIGLILICDPPKLVFSLPPQILPPSNKLFRRCFSDSALIDPSLKWLGIPQKKMSNVLLVEQISVKRRVVSFIN